MMLADTDIAAFYTIYFLCRNNIRFVHLHKFISRQVIFGICMSRKSNCASLPPSRPVVFNGLSNSPTRFKKSTSLMYSFKPFLAKGSSSIIIQLMFMLKRGMPYLNFNLYLLIVCRYGIPETSSLVLKKVLNFNFQINFK